MWTDRTYFERHSTRPQGGKEEKKAKKKVRTSVEHRGQTFYTISRVSWPRGSRRDEQRNRLAQEHEQRGRTDEPPPPSTLRFLLTSRPSLTINYRKSSARARFFPRASSGATVTAPASGAPCASAPSVFASGADTIMSLAK